MVVALLVGAGGFLGSITRYLLSGWVQRATQDSWFPYGTMSVNLLGCLIIGLLAGLAESRGILTPLQPRLHIDWGAGWVHHLFQLQL